MVAPIQNNVAALQAFSRQISVSADNVANALTDDFKKSRALNTEGENGQVESTITKIDTPGPLVEDPLSETGELKELSNTDIAEELTNQISAQQGFDANAKMIQAYEETVGTLVDMIG